jgi:hypothetical protein
MRKLFVIVVVVGMCLLIGILTVQAQFRDLGERSTRSDSRIIIGPPDDDDEDEDDDTPPAELIVWVDCNAGDSINAALQQPAGKLTIEIKSSSPGEAACAVPPSSSCFPNS